ncbi:hypothetical protein JIN85_08915 [Luteolibacter pohnpeiensis]|uniref:Uncharacterized protein n=1 Tax=Luteolibacter pohnpeiensis TaxID=454153 RepID=A0A934S3K3_9BACT|nr:hypothetical protein [Luteolibacter pohnpeiensis]MBK1882535.1 hypothetical protein [Luteolibacter pohnpeiensis]
MAWRIDEAVRRGEIDNTIEGRTTGRIWLVGREDPIVLQLDGDCWRDLAGSHLIFENPSPKSNQDAMALDEDQTGVIGDVTASRKTKTMVENGGKDPIIQWRNSLYLEWFSEINGRVVVESTSFKLTVSAHEWMMDEDAEAAQKLANLNSMRDFMAQVIRRKNYGEAQPKPAREMDEFAWEERLKESDRLTDAYQEVLEKYMEDGDSERKEAFVMGWDGLLDALAERDEAGDSDDEEFSDEADFPDPYEIEQNQALGIYEASELDDEEDPDAPDDGQTHPLHLKSRDLALRAVDLAECGDSPESPSYELISSLLQVSGKLAGALNGKGSGYEPETGFVLAVLKRCLGWLNKAVGACRILANDEADPDHKAALENLLLSCFEIRDEIIELRRELKQS